MNSGGWDQEWLLRQAIVVLAVAALTLVAQIYQRRQGPAFHGSRLLRANLIYRWIGPLACLAGIFIGAIMTGDRVDSRAAGIAMAFAFAIGGGYLTYTLSIRRIAWSSSTIAIWTPLKKWRAIDFADIVTLDYSWWRQELLLIGPGLTIGAGDSFDGFEQLIADLRRARPDLFDDGGDPEPDKLEAAASSPLAPAPIGLC